MELITLKALDAEILRREGDRLFVEPSFKIEFVSKMVEMFVGNEGKPKFKTFRGYRTAMMRLINDIVRARIVAKASSVQKFRSLIGWLAFSTFLGGESTLREIWGLLVDFDPEPQAGAERR
jgi:hypothetical protein